ncbi:MAG: hypothetical protein F6K42_37030, partial [Leptolyngbya sp. SIO1D8]|nr:hypothetical protein [Leptolyngbya sp. SIO1D8]
SIIDFPNVAEIGWRFISEAGLVDRVRYIPGNAVEAEWPGRQDAILMSYLMSGVPGPAVAQLLDKAFAALKPGGRLMVHDFMVDENRRGPALAALWQLQHMAFTPDAHSLSVGWLTQAAITISPPLTCISTVADPVNTGKPSPGLLATEGSGVAAVVSSIEAELSASGSTTSLVVSPPVQALSTTTNISRQSIQLNRRRCIIIKNLLLTSLIGDSILPSPFPEPGCQ